MRTTLTLIVAGLALAGCAGTASSSAQVSVYEQQFTVKPPTTEWLEQEEARLTELVKLSGYKQDRESLDYISSILRERMYTNFVGEAKLANTRRDLTLSWGNTGRGGAAFRKPAYIHTLSPKTRKDDFQPSIAYNLHQPTVQALPVSMSNANEGQGYSHYEMTRWQRFCNHGLGMDKRDWEFVRKEGIHNVPASLLGSCNPPKNMK